MSKVLKLRGVDKGLMYVWYVPINYAKVCSELVYTVVNKLSAILYYSTGLKSYITLWYVHVPHLLLPSK